MVNPISPGPRLGHGLCYDAKAKQVVLFGGFDKRGTPLSDTWGWDGVKWFLLAVSGPPARKWPAMAYDPQRGETILFGGLGGAGRSQPPFADSWRWSVNLHTNSAGRRTFMRGLIVFFALLLSFLAVSFAAFGSDGDAVLALIQGVLIDGTGSELVTDSVIIIRGGLIEAVGSNENTEIPESAQIIDLAGAYILPGFINAHVHSGYVEENLRAWAQAGVTTVRDLGTPFAWTTASESVFDDRDQLNEDNVNARLISVGPLVTTVGGYGGYAVTSPEDARVKINGLIDGGANLIKIAIEDDLQNRRWPMLSQEEINAIVETAHERGVKATAHISTSSHLQMALIAGVDDVAHMAINPVSGELLNQTVELGTIWVPTLELWRGISHRYGLSWDRTARRNLANFVEAGGIVALGTDYDGFSMPFDLGMPMTEVKQMAQAGMTPMQIIQAATRNAAVACDMAEQLGTIEQGKIADLLILNGNPLDDLDHLEDVHLVIHNGIVIRDNR